MFKAWPIPNPQVCAARRQLSQLSHMFHFSCLREASLSFRSCQQLVANSFTAALMDFCVHGFSNCTQLSCHDIHCSDSSVHHVPSCFSTLFTFNLLTYDPMRPRWREFLATFALADGLETNLDKWKWQVFFFWCVQTWEVHPRLAGIQYALMTYTLQHTANLFDFQISTVVYGEMALFAAPLLFARASSQRPGDAPSFNRAGSWGLLRRRSGGTCAAGAFLCWSREWRECRFVRICLKRNVFHPQSQPLWKTEE